MLWPTILGMLFVTAGSTILGSLPVLFHRYLKESHWRWSESFCGGVMISASIFSLYLPAYEILRKQNLSLWPILNGSLWGIFFILLAHKITHLWIQDHKRGRAFLFVLALGIHNIPEGMAVGVDVAALGWKESLPLSIAVFIQNLPEGLVGSMTFLVAGYSLKQAMLANGATALIEGMCALMGYAFVLKAGLGLSFLLSFSGACMSSIVIIEIINKYRAQGRASFAYSGFGVGLLVCAILDIFL